eukprot:m.27038 g.27038  ORF g.27038 m.27038 type:complete len:681 (+) comp11611_c0_seq1:145-2187(+)
MASAVYGGLRRLLQCPVVVAAAVHQPCAMRRLAPPIGLRFFSRCATRAAAAASTPAEALTMPSAEDSRCVRNLAIVAHVDHGKTSLVDCLLSQSGTMQLQSERVMDNNALEKERGITIFSKCAGIAYRKGDTTYKINLVDTPGHADFGGEVERVLSMVDGVVLLVDANEGVMAQTKYVLGKALARGLKALVVFNKVDRGLGRLEESEIEVLELFSNLGASAAQMDYPSFYASAKMGWVLRSMDGISDPSTITGDMSALFDAVVEHVQPPVADHTAPFRMLVTQIEPNAFLGKCLTGRIAAGVVKVGDTVQALQMDGQTRVSSRVTKIFTRRGLEQVAVDQAYAGDIVTLAGISAGTVNDTIAAPDVTEPLPATPIDPPTIAITVGVNSSPLAGQEGSQLTSNLIADRLARECESNVSLQIERVGAEQMEVKGRGELQLGILLEQMRREGFELGISPPRVLLKDTEDGKQLEPIEEVTIDVDSEHSGMVVDKLSRRKGEMVSFDDVGHNRVKIVFHIPTRGLIGYHRDFKQDTSGGGLLQQCFLEYGRYRGLIQNERKGALVSVGTGDVTAYALESIEPRGKLFVGPGAKAYNGMIVGEHSREEDLEVNPVKGKQLTNIRAVGKDEFVRLTPPLLVSLDWALSYVKDDEMIELTPSSIRLRKRELDPARRRADMRKKKVQK